MTPLADLTDGLPPLGGRLLLAYRAIFVLLFAAALGVLALSWMQSGTSLVIWSLRLVKAAVLLSVAVILLRRRKEDPVAAMLALAFLIWTITSSVDFATATVPGWPALLDRFRFLLFALALLLFPDGRWLPRWTQATAVAVVLTFLLGVAEGLRLLPTKAFLPLAIGCVVVALGALLIRFRLGATTTQRQQVKWVALGLVVGIALILSARAGAAITPHSAMPLAGALVLEGMFQLGIITIALGFLTSLLRYRLYDAETVISRSAVYAGLTVALVGTFAAVEALIEMMGQRYFGAGIGNLSGAVAAAVAAVLLAPLHERISGWAEHRFQRDLIRLKKEVPEILGILSNGSIRQLAEAVVPRIAEAIHADRAALLIDRKIVAVVGMSKLSAQRWASQWKAPPFLRPLDRHDDSTFPIKVALQSPFARTECWLLLGPRPDGSLYGEDDLEAISEIVPSLRHALLNVVAREREQLDAKRKLKKMEDRLVKLEAFLDDEPSRTPSFQQDV